MRQITLLEATLWCPTHTSDLCLQLLVGCKSNPLVHQNQKHRCIDPCQVGLDCIIKGIYDHGCGVLPVGNTWNQAGPDFTHTLQVGQIACRVVHKSAAVKAYSAAATVPVTDTPLPAPVAKAHISMSLMVGYILTQ